MRNTSFVPTDWNNLALLQFVFLYIHMDSGPQVKRRLHMDANKKTKEQ